MALPAGAAAALAGDMGKNGIGKGGDMPPMPEDGEPEDGDKDAVYKQICGDAFDAMKSGSKEEFCNYMLELLERYNGDEESKEGEAPEEV